MLVLSRKKGERILVGDDVQVVVVDVRGDRVKLGFEAPDDVAIHRQEVCQRIKSSDLHKKEDCDDPVAYCI
jgi:carbon storage regulator